MLKLLIPAALALLPLDIMPAQSAPPMFEVASVKVSRVLQDSGGYKHQITPGGIVMRSSMGYCIRVAYGLSFQRPYELVGPAWLDPPTDVILDITAKTATPATPEEVKAMLQDLLMERFHLKVHRETRDMPVYELHRLTGPLLLKPSATGEEPKARSTGYQKTEYQHVTMEQFTFAVGPPWTSRPVVNMTALSGSYDFTMDLSRYVTDPDTGKPITDAQGRIDAETAIAQALRDQLGLTLKSGRAPISVLVVDQVEKQPAEK